MSFTLVAPFPLTQTTTTLPNPKFGNGEGGTGTLNVLRAVRGGRRTYVKSRSGRRKLSWTFNLTRNKAIELLEFYRSYNAVSIFIQDQDDRAWIGNIVNNPFEIQMERRGLPTRQDWPAGETCVAQIEFEGFRTTTTLASDRTTKIITVTGISELVGLGQNVLTEIPLPNITALQNNWDAIEAITGIPDNDILMVWPDVGPANNDLISTIGGVFNQTIDRSPRYRGSSLVMNRRPSVIFYNVEDGLSTDVAAMESTSNMSLFPARRGTIFWVLAHTVGNSAYSTYIDSVKFPGLYDPVFSEQLLQVAIDGTSQPNDATEYGVWSLADSLDRVEQVHFSGSSSQFTPASAHFEPVTGTPEFRLATSNNGSIPNMVPHIYTMVRSTDVDVRFRTNGVERTGYTMPINNAGYLGKFHVNDQVFIPQFNAKITGEWGQILVYNRRLVDSEIDAVEEYLSIRWGIPLGQVTF